MMTHPKHNCRLVGGEMASAVLKMRQGRYEFVELILIATTDTGEYPPGLPICGWLVTPPRIGGRIRILMHNLLQSYSMSEVITVQSNWPGSRSVGFLTRHSAYLLQFIDEPPTSEPRCDRCHLPLFALPPDEPGHNYRVCPLCHQSYTLAKRDRK